MKTAQIIKHYLSFSRAEQRGILILVIIILLINLFRMYFPDATRLKPIDLMAFKTEISSFEAALGQAKRVTGRHSYGSLPDSSESLRSNKDPSFFIELNRADTLDLQRLRGIGPSFARRIIGYRKRLGGFTSVRQLLEVYGMDSARYLVIIKYLAVDTAYIQRMNLNTISFKNLIAHPYMPYEFAKEIAIYQKKHKGIKAIEELEGLKSYDSATFVKLRPYIAVE